MDESAKRKLETTDQQGSKRQRLKATDTCLKDDYSDDNYSDDDNGVLVICHKDSVEYTTRSGRTVKTPKRLNVVNYAPAEGQHDLSDDDADEEDEMCESENSDDREFIDSDYTDDESGSDLYIPPQSDDEDDYDDNGYNDLLSCAGS